MGVTGKLLALYRVDQQLRGLNARLRSAEAYLRQQEKLLADHATKREAIEAELKQAQATNHNDENEIKGIDERIEASRERMNNAQTSKEHSATLTEINTLKADRALIEERVLTAMGKIEELNAELATIDEEAAKRQKIRDTAATERDARAAEIKDRVAELEAEREGVVKEVPAPALTVYQGAIDRGVEDVMAPIEEQDKRNMEYTCGSCYTHLPIEKVSVLMQRGDLTTCPSCDVILYLGEEVRGSLESAKPNARSRAVTVD